MSVIEIHSKSEPQPWMAYKCGLSNSRSLDCCSSLFTDNDALLPFQVISTGPFEKIEISPYGEDSWTEIALTIHEELIEGLWFISYHGDALAAPLTCGTYDVQLTAGGVWTFEPITVKDFTITTNTFIGKDYLMGPLRFGERVFSNKPIIASVDSFLPFMYATLNPSTTPEYYIVDEDGIETLLTITVDVKTISGKTYYIHEAECFYPFLACGNYYLKIVDGAFTYYSVWFHAESNINDIADGYRPILGSDYKIILTDNCEISLTDCSNITKYGMLYNYYVISNAKGIAPDGYHVPTRTEWLTLTTYLGGVLIAGGPLKEIGYVNWLSPNTGATNSSGFSAIGSGQRRDDGSFLSTKAVFYMWCTTLFGAGSNYILPIQYNSIEIYASIAKTFKTGCSIRFIRDSLSGYIAGEKIIDYDGNEYNTVQIGTQVWMTNNLRVTHYSDGTEIPHVTSASEWASLATGAWCNYNNNTD
jgi:uncharacterized protein (TIGR02145 family)